jgi:hypothetical protein
MRAKTVDSRPEGLDTIMRQNTSLPNLRVYAPSSMAVTYATEYLEILPVERYESCDSTIVGHYAAPIAGDYVLFFDNSYSVSTSKELFLTVTVGPTIPISQEAFSGWLLKKKQRRLQGWGRRWFQLDRNGILSYYEDRFSPCRGSMDLHHCTVTKTPQRLMMTIDSGNDTYHLRALDAENYGKWSEHFNMIRLQSAIDGLNLSGNLPDTSAHPGPSIATFSERLSDNLQKSERLLCDLRALATKEDDGAMKFLAPLEETFHSLHDLYESLSEYAIFLQRTGRRMSQISNGNTFIVSAGAQSEYRAGSIDEFFDAEEIIITDISEEDEMDFFGSRESVSADTDIGLLSSTEIREFRQRMPHIAPPCNISVSSILRKNIGKDWSSIPMPVALNEPLSALQRLCEELEYSELLDAAAKCPSSLDRMVLVAAFAVSGYANTIHRVERKPFTPILGETFEYERMDKGYRFIAEKVSHRPLIMAMHAQSEKWSFWQDQRIKDKFWGKSMEYTPLGSVHVYFPDTGDHFVWKKVVTCVRNIFMGNKWVEHYGEMTMRNLRTGDLAKISFKPNSSGFFSTNTTLTNEVLATVTPSKNGPESQRDPISLRGRWDSVICRENGDDDDLLIWQAALMPNDHTEYFGFAEFAIGLNDLPDWLQPHLPLTDSRLRPDQRLLENSRLEEAETLKQEVEQRQREARILLEQQGKKWEPVWFKFEPPTKEDPEGAWRIKDPSEYWECRRQGRWPVDIKPLW